MALAKSLLPLIFASVVSKNTRSSSRMGFARSRRAATRSAGDLPSMSASTAKSRRSCRAPVPPPVILSRHARRRFCAWNASPSRRPLSATQARRLLDRPRRGRRSSITVRVKVAAAILQQGMSALGLAALPGEALARTSAVMTKLGLPINDVKTSLKDARRESFVLLGYIPGPRHFRNGGRWYPPNGPSPTRSSVPSATHVI